ncbi:MAG: UDP-3-O-[3-hydroxymyristoyl] glucosamine N-acyltransferase [Chlamydiales bacterium]|jgi:UDP-3-O-[3-hydroxymyristoyl] glucosamine N-acyltransferase
MTSSTLSELAQLLDAVLVGDGNRVVCGAAPLLEATSDEVSFLADPRYRKELEITQAAAVVIGDELAAGFEREGLALLVCKDPGQAFSAVVEAFARSAPPIPAGIHPSAVVDAGAELGEGVCIGPLSVVGEGAQLGDGVVLHPNVTVGAGVQIGAGTVLHAGVVLYPFVTVGKHCVLHSNTVVGSDGLGFDMRDGAWHKVPQGGSVEIADDVELGACVAIDRARTGATRIGKGAKLDNMVHVAHNVQIGAHSLLAAQVGIAGSARLGTHVVLGGQSGVTGHVELGDGVGVGAKSGVMSSVDPGVQVAGFPAWPLQDELRQVTFTRRLRDLFRTVKNLQERIDQLEGGDS